MQRPQPLVPMLIKLFSLALLCLSLLGGSAAGAKTRMASVVRGVGAGSDKAAGYVAHFMRKKFAEDDRYEVIELASTLGSPDAEKAKSAFETADNLIIKGQEAFESLDLDPAVEHLSTALSKYERHAASVTDFEKVAEVLMLLGATHILRGEERLGSSRLAQAVALFPEIEPDPRVFNPGMREVFDDAKNQLTQRPTGELSLTSNPSYAEIYIDGRFAGVTPLLVPDVLHGGHYVRLVKDSYRDWGKMLNVKGGRETNETAEMKSTANFADFDGLVEEALVSLGKEGESDAMGDAIDQLGVLLNIDHLFLCEVRLDGELVRLRASIYDLNRLNRLKSAEVGFPYASDTESYAREVSAFFAKEFNKKALGPLPGDKDYKPEIDRREAPPLMCGSLKCSTFKLAVSASVIGGGAALMIFGSTVLWPLAHENAGRFKDEAQATDEYRNLKSTGQVLAGFGDGLFFTGAAVAVVGTILILVWEPAPSPAQVVDQSRGLDWSVMLGPHGLGTTVRWHF